MTRSVWPDTVGGGGAVGVAPWLITTGPLGGAVTTVEPLSRSTSLISLVLHTQPPSVAISSGVVSTIIVLLKRLVISCPPLDSCPVRNMLRPFNGQLSCHGRGRASCMGRSPDFGDLAR